MRELTEIARSNNELFPKFNSEGSYYSWEMKDYPIAAHTKSEVIQSLEFLVWDTSITINDIIPRITPSASTYAFEGPEFALLIFLLILNKTLLCLHLVQINQQVPA